MLKICLAFLKSEPQHAYKRYAYKKHVLLSQWSHIHHPLTKRIVTQPHLFFRRMSVTMN